MRKVERKRMNSEHKKYFLVGSLCIDIFLMLGIGYAVLSQQLDINGTAQITSNWKILFTSAEEKEMNNATTTRKEITDLTTLTLDVNLTQPGASATYDVVVENQGDLDAVLSSINGVNENNNKDPKAIKVGVENIKVGDPLLATESKTFQVKVYWDANVDFNETNMSKEIEITLTYEQSDDGVPVGPIPSDGVDMGGQNVELVTSGDGLYEDQYEDGRYVYRGSEPNNYIQFNNELWRIIAKETDGTYKIIRDEILPQNANYTPMAYDVENHRLTENNTYCTNPQWGCGVFAAVSGTFQTPDGKYSGTVTEDSSIKEYLNNTYYPTLNGTAKTQVQSHTFNIGSVQFLAVSGNDSIQKNIAGEKMYQWTGNVGLVNVSDLLRASTNIACTSATDEMNAVMQEVLKETCGSYLTTMSPINEELGGIGYWTMNAFSAESGDGSGIVWAAAFFQGVGAFGYRSAGSGSDDGARPVLYLKSDIEITGGDGTKGNPFVIG